MKKLFWCVSCLVLALALFSCSNGSLVDTQKVEKQDLSKLQTQRMGQFYIIYKGVTYNVPVRYEKDSTIFLNSEFNKIFDEEISKLPDRALLTFKTKDNATIIKYYTSSAEMDKANNFIPFQMEKSEYKPDPTIISDIPINPIQGLSIGYCQMYDDRNFGDRMIPFQADKDHWYYVTQLRDYYGFNDKISSIAIWNYLKPNVFYKPSTLRPPATGRYGRDLSVVLYGWEDDNFRGKRKAFAVSTCGGHVVWPDLKNQEFNDKITSIAFQCKPTADLDKDIIWLANKLSRN